APSITSDDHTTFTAGSLGSFTVTTTGYPAPSLSETGTLPDGVTFTDNGNGTATLAGTPTLAGSYPFSITASNSIGTDDSQSFTLAIDPGTAAQLVVTTQPDSSYASAAPISAAVTIEDAQNNTVDDSATQVTVALNNTSGATLSGTKTVTASNGVAS